MSEERPLVSIVICLHIMCDRFFSDLRKFHDLTYRNIEIILVTNKPTKFILDQKSIRVVVPRKTRLSLSEKRDIGYRQAKGQYVAYIDDDAYPKHDWIAKAIRVFETEKNVGAVGGPNLTPPDDPYWSRIGGKIFESYLTSGGQQWRFVPTGRMDVAELQGVNLIIPRSILVRLGGFKSRLYSGDDSKVCSDIRKLGLRIIYDSKVVVYHHRRPFPLQHLTQIRNMGHHRGFFVKAHPGTLAPLYFIPSFLAGGVIIGFILSLFFPITRISFGMIFLFFYVLAYVSSIRYAGWGSAGIVALGIILTHITYGISFIQGIFSSKIYK